jgi:hypothetical protein
MVAYLHGFTYAFADATHRGQRWRVLETPQLPDTILSTLDGRASPSELDCCFGFKSAGGIKYEQRAA